MFLNCLLLDLTVIDLISIVHMGTIWVEIAKIFGIRTSGGRGGFSDCRHPQTRRGGGVKKVQIFAGVLCVCVRVCVILHAFNETV